MRTADILIDAFGRIREEVEQVVDGLSPEQLAARIDPGANSIGWLVWHLTRIQDAHVGEIAETEQVWTAQGWANRFELPYPVAATGYGHGADDVARFRVVSGELLAGYHHAVHTETIGYVAHVTSRDLARIVDDSWDPPVSLGVRLVSVISDDLQHVGQAAFVRGVLERQRDG